MAERSGLAEARARALGGLGDAEYARGDIVASGRYFRQCVDESRSIGLGKVEVSNLPMCANNMILELELRDALDTGQEAVALAVSVGQKRAELIAHHICMIALLELGRPEEAPWIPARSATRLREADLHILSKFGKQGLERRLEPEAFAGREVGREDDLLDVLVGCAVDIEVARQPSA